MIERLAAALFLLPVQLAAQGVGPNQCTGPPYGDDPALYAGTKDAYSAEDDRLFRRNVTGDSAESAL
ncbi:MAG: hypothetical protein ACHP9W_00840 [Steroidobacterales bacterium]